jgi:predicted acylesterase/phospholipase RssA
MHPPTNSHENVEETRIALAFSGGVALAVYESGVALEFFRLVSNDASPYAKLRQYVGRIVVDVITGSSAGGLNGAFLANALVNQGDVWQLLPLWRDKADFDTLLYGPFKADPQSLLDGDYFYDVLLNALREKGSGSGGQASLQESVDLYITGTNLDGHRVDITTPDGAEIATRTHRQVFRFQYRRDQKPQQNDFRGDANIQRLALAARTTASFPLAFAPMLIEQAQMGHVVQNLDKNARAYHIDGGVLDNEPIGLALQAIDARSAQKRVTRRLFYIEPDPELIKIRGWQTKEQTYAPLDVVYKALIALPAYQSVTNSLQDIERRNQTVLARRRSLDYYETTAGSFQLREAKRQHGELDAVRQIEADEGLARHPVDHHDAFKFAGPARFDSAFYRALEDGYLDLRLERDVSAQVYECFRELSVALTKPLDQEATDGVAADRGGEPGKKKKHDAPVEVVPCAESAKRWPLRNGMYQLKSMIAAHFDLRYYQRYYDYLMGAVLKHYPQRPMGTGSGTDNDEMTFYADTTVALNELVKHCCDQMEAVKELERANVNRQAAEYVYLAEQIRATLQRVIALRRLQEQKPEDADWQERFAERLRKLLGKVQTMPLQSERCELFNNMRRADWGKLQNVVLRVLQKHQDEKPVADKEKTPKQQYIDGLIGAYWELRDAMQSFYMRDVMLYPMMQGADLQTELEQIQVARISPIDAGAYRKGLTAADKLAGEVLWHFGGFLKESWRGNDLVWGRLDAAEIIVKKLLPADQWESIGLPLVQELQAGIVAEMKEQYGMSIFEPDTSTALKDLVGKQTLANLPCTDKFSWLMQGTLTIGKIMRQGLADSKSSTFLPWLMIVPNKLIQALTALAVLAKMIAKLSWPWVLVLGLAVGAAAAVAAFGFHPWRWFGLG